MAEIFQSAQFYVIAQETKDDKDWRQRADCRGADPDIFFPEKGQGRNSSARAKAICRNCPVLQRCLKEALNSNERFGVWGGMSTRERDKYAREHRRQSQY